MLRFKPNKHVMFALSATDLHTIENECKHFSIPNISCFLNVYFVKWHDDVTKWKHFPRYWPFVRGIQRSPVNSPHKGLWRGALMFPLICARINGWVHNREADDLRRHRAHHDVIVMEWHIFGGNAAFSIEYGGIKPREKIKYFYLFIISHIVIYTKRTSNTTIHGMKYAYKDVSTEVVLNICQLKYINWGKYNQGLLCITFGLIISPLLTHIPSSAAYVRQWTGSALVKILTCRPFGAKSLSKSVLGYCQLDSEISIKNSNFSSTKMYLKISSVKWPGEREISKHGGWSIYSAVVYFFTLGWNLPPRQNI